MLMINQSNSRLIAHDASVVTITAQNCILILQKQLLVDHLIVDRLKEKAF